MDSVSNILIEHLTGPYKYIASFSDYIYIPNINDIITIINENTSKTYDIINQSFASMIPSELPIDIPNNIPIAVSKLNINIQKQFQNNTNANDNGIYDIIQNEIILYIGLTLCTIMIYFTHKLYNEYLLENEYDKLYNMNNKLVNTLLDDIENNPNKITQGFFTKSIYEINTNNKNIIDKMLNNNDNTNSYYVLLRIKMKHVINVYEPSNETTQNDNDNESERRQVYTNDMYMILKFTYVHDNNTDINNINVSQLLLNTINILNSLTRYEYKNKDFVIVAISKSNNIKPNEFFDGLKNINYELFNIKNIIFKNYNYGFILLLPMKDVYDLFLDVYNNTIFVSSLYKINKNNTETWGNTLINKTLNNKTIKQ